MSSLDHEDGQPTGYTCNGCQQRPATIVRWMRGALGDSVVHACSMPCAEAVRIVREARFITRPRTKDERAAEAAT